MSMMACGSAGSPASYLCLLLLLSLKVTAVSSKSKGPSGARFSVKLLGASGSSKPTEIRDYPGNAQTQSSLQQQQQQRQQQVSQARQGPGPWCSCSVRCQQLGELRQLEAWLEVEGSGPCAAWMLQHVEVQHMGTGQVGGKKCLIVLTA
jgi:hypothetical protein